VVRHWPALDVPGADDLLLALLDDFSPTALESRERGLRVFFATREQRDAALVALAVRRPACAPIDVSDEDWALRSQQNLAPILVGRIRVVPEFRKSGDPDRRPLADAFRPIEMVIEPSMGFGTGHHATTRLCLAAMQALDLNGRSVLDVGTGSGILAIAAARLGASVVYAIDSDADAIQSAEANLALNPGIRNVTFEVLDLEGKILPAADLVTANLTGNLLVKAADGLCAAVAPGGAAVLSGLLAVEEHEVREAFSSFALHRREQEDEWVALTLKKG
jgi:ribosomal protein L11 methyltransferase